MLYYGVCVFSHAYKALVRCGGHLTNSHVNAIYKKQAKVRTELVGLCVSNLSMIKKFDKVSRILCGTSGLSFVGYGRSFGCKMDIEEGSRAHRLPQLAKQ